MGLEIAIIQTVSIFHIIYILFHIDETVKPSCSVHNSAKKKKKIEGFIRLPRHPNNIVDNIEKIHRIRSVQFCPHENVRA